MIKARYQFALRYRDWTIEDWKRVIWTNETSVILNSRRGKIRIWRQSHEVFVKSIIRRRFVDAMKFMFWAYFSYDKKSSCYIWKKETAVEKRECELDLTKINAALKSECKAQWELKSGMRRMGLKNRDEKKPSWKFTAVTGKIIITGKKRGITWYRYQKKVFILKLLSFA